MDADAPIHTDQTAFWARAADRFYPALVRLLIGVLIMALCLWIGAGTVNILVSLGAIVKADWRGIAEHTVVNSLIILALFEVIRTLRAYLELGRVRVTFILDTVIVVLITELMGLWFKKYTIEQVLLSLGVIVTLVALRIVTARYSPTLHGPDE